MILSLLPSPLKTSIRDKLRRRLFGDRLFLDEVFNVNHVYELIKRHHIELETAVDIGANTGQWAKTFMQQFPGTQLLSIEANPENLPALLKVNPNSMQACFAELDGDTREFYLPNPTVERINTGASFYREVLPGYEEPTRLQLVTSTLDSLNRRFDLIKLDVQGAELDVLRGGEKALRSAKIIMIEVSLCRYNYFAPLAAEVISYLHDRGFLFLAVNEVLCHARAPIQLDCCFVCSELEELSFLEY
jgi:FkbM family methyltransferase